MRDHRERLLILPYSMGCATESCISLGKKNHPKRKKHKPKHALFSSPKKERRSLAKMIKIRSFFVLPNYYISTGVNRMIKGFKSFPQLFVYKDEDEEESDEDQEGEMEIGLPTDVKHVAHIGWDGACTTINPMKGWENLEAADILSLSSSISLRDFEIAMNAQNSNGESVCTNKMVQKIVDGKN